MPLGTERHEETIPESGSVLGALGDGRSRCRIEVLKLDVRTCLSQGQESGGDRAPHVSPSQSRACHQAWNLGRHREQPPPWASDRGRPQTRTGGSRIPRRLFCVRGWPPVATPMCAAVLSLLQSPPPVTTCEGRTLVTGPSTRTAPDGGDFQHSPDQLSAEKAPYVLYRLRRSQPGVCRRPLQRPC